MRQFSIELTTTNACSFRCSYCFESDFRERINLLNKDYDKLVLRLRQLIDSDWMHEIADRVVITFWGGEPTLNSDLIYRIVEEFSNDSRVHFYIYTNGSRINQLIPSILKVGSRFRVQVSYDGNPIHDLRRRTIDNKPTSGILFKGFETLDRHNIKFGLKSTITYPDFVHIGEAWDDILSLRKKYGRNIKYSLTVDYHNTKFEDYRKIVENGLIDIARSEYKFYKIQGYFLSNIFEEQRKTCDMSYILAIDVKGNMYPCHGCIYSNEELSFGNVFDNGFIDTVKQNHKKFTYTEKTDEACSNCVALSCIRCNVKKYEMSCKEDFIERWTDYTAQKNLCEYYKLAGRIGRGLYKVLLGE